MPSNLKLEINKRLEEGKHIYFIFGKEKPLKNFGKFIIDINEIVEIFEPFPDSVLYRSIVERKNNVIEHYNRCCDNDISYLDSYFYYLSNAIRELVNMEIFKLKKSYTELLAKENISDSNLLNKYYQFLNGNSYEISGKFIADYVKLKIHHKTLQKVESETMDEFKAIENDIDFLYSNLTKLQEKNIEVQNNHRDLLITQKEEFQMKIEEYEEKITTLTKEFAEEKSRIENAYSQQMQLEKPVEFWSALALEYKKRYKSSRCWLSVLSIIFTILLFVLFSIFFGNSIQHENGLIKIEWSDGKVIPISAILVLGTLTSIIIYVLRIFVKVMMSNRHLWHEAEQKEKMTNFYLTLLKDTSGGIQLEATEREIIIANLFSKIDAGLIKHNSDEVSDVISLITKK